MLSLRDLDLDDFPEVIALTSSTKSAVALRRNKISFSPIEAIDLPKDETLPSSWMVEKGQDTFQSLHSRRRTFRSLRPAPNTEYSVALDATGYLNLFAKNHQPLWRSDRAWGNRLFILPPDLIAVCDSRQFAFVVFRLQNQSLQLVGQSPTFSGNVSAILSVQSKNKNGLLVSTISTNAAGLPVSRLQFFPGEALPWILPISLAEPRFPDYEASLTFLQEAGSENIWPDWHREYPPMVWPNVFETLYGKDENGAARPLLASGIRADSTSRVWEISLRPDIRFSDGSPLTAEIVLAGWKYNWRACKKNSCAQQWLWTNIVGVNEFIAGKRPNAEGLQAIDAHTLKIALKEPRPDFAEHLMQPCFSVLKRSQEKKSLPGTGPFQMVAMKNDRSGSVLECRRNAYYHGGLPPLQEIKFIFFKANLTEVLSNLEAAGATLRRKKEIEVFRKIGKIDLRPFAVQPIYFLALNPSVQPLAELSQRRRIANASNREFAANFIEAAECEVATNFFAAAVEDAASRPEDDLRQPRRAMTISFRAQDEVAGQIAERLKIRLSRLRIPYAGPRALSNSAFEQLRRNGKYGILIDSYAPAFESPLYNLTQLLRRGYIVDPEISSALDRALAVSSDDAAGLEKTLMRQAILYPLLRAKNYAVLPEGIEGIRLLEAERIDFTKAWLPRRQ